VTRVIERVPSWLWVLLAAIGALCLSAFAGSILAALRARRADRQRRQVMDDIGLLQAALLPPVPEDLDALELSSAYRPADGPAAGGDFYDAFPLRGGRVGFMIGDVSGHGRAVLGQTAAVRFTVRAYLEAGLEPRDVLKLSQSVLEDKLAEDFVTVLLATYDPASGRLTYAGAGHPPPLVRGALPAPAVTAVSAPLIGAGLGTGLRQTTVSVARDSTVCLYTDGLVEAMVDDHMLGRNRLAGLLETLGPETTAPELLDRIVEATDHATDDMAVCLARISSDAADRPYVVEELEVSRRDVGRGIAERFLAACDVSATDAAEALGQARAVCEEFGAAILRVHRHEHPQRVEVAPAAVEGLISPEPRRAASSGGA
jgi:hypothetical protein